MRERQDANLAALRQTRIGLVAQVDPNLVVYDKNGEPLTVRYDAVNAMLLNEVLKEHRKVVEQQATIDQLKATAAQGQTQIEALRAGLQKVNAELELNRPARQIAADQ